MINPAARRIGLIFSTLCGVGAFTCLLCNVLITGGVTWAAYPTLSILLGWLVVMAIVRSTRHRMRSGLIALSVLTLPFLFALDLLTPGDAWFTRIALPIGAISIAFVWISYFVYKRIHRLWALLAVYMFQYGVLLNTLIMLVVSRYTGNAFLQLDLAINLLSSIALTVLFACLDARKARVAK